MVMSEMCQEDFEKMSGPGNIKAPKYNPRQNFEEAINAFLAAYPIMVKDMYDRIDQSENFQLLMGVMTEKDKVKYSMVIQKESLAFYLCHFSKFQKEQKQQLNKEYGKFVDKDDR